MSDMTPFMRVGELATHHPRAVKVFQRHGIDFCCGGNKPLVSVCEQKQLNAEQVIEEIRTEESDAIGIGIDWSARPIPELIGHLLARYHAPLREDLARLEALAHKVNHVHAEKDASLAELETAVIALRDDLEPHLDKEEQVLFPMILAGRGYHARIPIERMQDEHDTTGDILRRIRALTHDFTLPPKACRTWTALWEGLADVERDIHEHIHLENNVLFPRALDGN